MSSCLGIYVDKFLIKYAKIQKEKDNIKIIAFKVVFYEDLNKALTNIISETNSSNIPISINITEKFYNNFDIKATVDRNDIKKSIDMAFKDILKNYKIKFDFPISTSIANLIPKDNKDNIVIVNIEDKAQITTIKNGKIYKVDILEEGMEQIISKIIQKGNTAKKAYEICKKLVFYTNDTLDEEDEEYLKIIKPIWYKIVTKTKEIIDNQNFDINKLYITGFLANTNNIASYFQEYILNIKCEILKPFFLETTSVKTSINDYIEVNSAISLALNGVGYNRNNELNSTEKEIDNSKISSRVNKKRRIIRKKRLTVKEKLMLRICFVTIISIVTFLGFSNNAYNSIEESNYSIEKAATEIEKQYILMENDLNKINEKTEEYNRVIDSINSLTEVEINEKRNRIIPKDSIPNMLNKITELIPRQVKIISIKNETDSKQIIIEAESEKYEQLGYFSSILKTENVLKNIKSTSGDKEGEVVKITIEGELP